MALTVIRRRLAPKAVPKDRSPSTLSHYTTLDGLIGIINSGHLWASNVSFLNDRRELTHGLDASIAALKTFHSDKTFGKWHPVLDKIVDEFKSGVVPHTYAICLCANSDVLSQWRGYGGATQGVAISLSQSKLSASLDSQKALLYRVQYGNVTAKQKFGDSLRSALDDLDEKTTGFDEASMERVARRVMSRLLPQFKHYGFREEREWRYVVQQNTMREEVCYRAKNNVIVPYIKLGSGAGAILPIKSITVGPGRDQKLTIKSIELFLERTGYAGTTIRASDVPYRA